MEIKPDQYRDAPSGPRRLVTGAALTLRLSAILKADAEDSSELRAILERRLRRLAKRPISRDRTKPFS